MPAQSNMTQVNVNQKFNAYLKNQIYSSNPVQLVVKVYDFAILGCKTKDMNKVSRALVELISALRFEYEDISIGLFRLYQYCLDEVKKGNFDDPLSILTELRNTWVELAKTTSVSKKNEEAFVG